MKDTVIVTTVSSSGSVAADYNLATFNIGLDHLDDTVPEAKLRLKDKVDQLMLALDNIKSTHQVELIKNSLKTSINVQPHYEYGKNNKTKLVGFMASYVMSFKISDMDKVSIVYDQLTSLPEVTVQNPQYQVKHADKLKKKALEKAWNSVEERFTEECEVLGLKRENYEVISWRVNYNDHNREYGAKVMALSAGVSRSMTAPDPIDLFSGQANIMVDLSVNYGYRD